jgi:hypothetical protein
MVHKSRCVRPRHLDSASLASTQTGLQTLVDEFNCVVQESYTVQDPPAPPSDTLLLPPRTSLHSTIARNQELVSRMNRDRFCHLLNEPYLVNS